MSTKPGQGQTAERRAKGLCLKCGKRPPAPNLSQCEPCIEKRRRADLARHHRRTAERVAQGLCPKCGKRPRAPGRSMCGPCADKRNRASRARDARLRAAGTPRRDRERARAYERERSRREVEERRAAGLCLHCGKAPSVEGRTACEPCAEARRARERAKYAKAKAEGKLYGGRKVETRRRYRPRTQPQARRGPPRRRPVHRMRQESPGRRRRELRVLPRGEAGRRARSVRFAPRRRAVRFVRRPHDRRRLALRALRRRRDRALSEEERRAVRGVRQAQGRGAMHRLRRALAGGRPLRALRPPVLGALGVLPGDAGLRPLAHRRRPQDGDEHGPYDSWEDVALAMAFARLAPDRVEVITDVPLISRHAAWESRPPRRRPRPGTGVLPDSLDVAVGLTHGAPRRSRSLAELVNVPGLVAVEGGQPRPGIVLGYRKLRRRLAAMRRSPDMRTLIARNLLDQEELKRYSFCRLAYHCR